jgi:hypothetical protein
MEDLSLEVGQIMKLDIEKGSIQNASSKGKLYEVISINHPIHGKITKVDTSEPMYRIDLASGKFLTVDSEELAGTVIYPEYEQRNDWTFDVELKKSSHPK